MSGRVVILRGDAAHLPLPDESVDLIVTSPPYWALRDYRDGGASLKGQIGSESSPGEFLSALWSCTGEWIRVLKPEGSLFVNLGDAYSARADGSAGRTWREDRAEALPAVRNTTGFAPRKSLMLLPQRYAIGCVDDLGLTLRAEIIWSKPNGLPESVTDRVKRAHEHVFHFSKRERYFAAVDEIRIPTADVGRKVKSVKAGPLTGAHGSTGHDGNGMRMAEVYNNPLGALPGSVWEIPSQPLSVPDALGVDHFAAFPMELPRRAVLGWSPTGICTECGHGRKPVAVVANIEDRKGRVQRIVDFSLDAAHGHDGRGGERWKQTVRIAGHACACTPYTDHPGTRTATRRRDYNPSQGASPQGTYGRRLAGEYNRVGPWREYHFSQWIAPPTRPAVVLDPFGGTGTTALVAAAHGRTGITVDLSADYCRLAQWRTADPAERARALNVPKPPPVIDGQGSLFDALGDVS